MRENRERYLDSLCHTADNSLHHPSDINPSGLLSLWTCSAGCVKVCPRSLKDDSSFPLKALRGELSLYSHGILCRQGTHSLLEVLVTNSNRSSVSFFLPIEWDTRCSVTTCCFRVVECWTWPETPQSSRRSVFVISAHVCINPPVTYFQRSRLILFTEWMNMISDHKVNLFEA
jgi:hypothetical protein